MTRFLVLVAVFLIANADARAQDDHFEFHSPFGSDGTNQPGLSVQERNAEVYDHLWDFYLSARKEIIKPFPKASPDGYSQASLDHDLGILHFGRLLETMVELRAFTTQNPGFAVGNENIELMKIDGILRLQNLHYTSHLIVNPATGRAVGSGQQMVDYCAFAGANKVAVSLRPLLYQTSGLPRPVPSWQSIEHHTMVFD